MPSTLPSALSDIVRQHNRESLETQRTWLDSILFDVGASILDIGCGIGFHSEYFKQRGLNPVACDRDSAQFLFHGQIPFVTSLDEVNNHKFNYVFASHVLEHCPNPYDALKGWINILEDGGTLIVVVPPYFPTVSNDHWNVGWNVGQLAMFMVSAGIDCSRGSFAKIGDNICGYGKKADFPHTGFMINLALPYLPQGLAQRHYLGQGVEDHIPGEVALADEKVCLPNNIRGQCNFPMKSYTGLRPLLISSRYNDWHCEYTPAISMPDDLLFICHNEGSEVALRFNFASGSLGTGGKWPNLAEYYFELKAGLTCAWFTRADMRHLRGKVDFDQVDQANFGGSGVETSVKFGLFDSAGNLALPGL